MNFKEWDNERRRLNRVIETLTEKTDQLAIVKREGKNTTHSELVYAHPQLIDNERLRELWAQCDNCYGMQYRVYLRQKSSICEDCGFPMQMGSSDRIELLVDPGTWVPMDQNICTVDVFLGVLQTEQKMENPWLTNRKKLNNRDYPYQNLNFWIGYSFLICELLPEEMKYLPLLEKVSEAILEDKPSIEEHKLLQDVDIHHLFFLAKFLLYKETLFLWSWYDLRWYAWISKVPQSRENLLMILEYNIILFKFEKAVRGYIKKKLDNFFRNALEQHIFILEIDLDCSGIPWFKDELELLLSNGTMLTLNDYLFLHLWLTWSEGWINWYGFKVPQKEMNVLQIFFLNLGLVGDLPPEEEIPEEKTPEKKVPEKTLSERVIDVVKRVAKDFPEKEKEIPEKEDYESWDKDEYNFNYDFNPRDGHDPREEEYVRTGKFPEEGPSIPEEEPSIEEEEELDMEEKPYMDHITSYQIDTGLTDAIQTGIGQLNGIPIAIGVMDFQFMGGSMGSVVGEKMTRLIEYAANKSLPLITVCASGGARMQEGSFSLMQMGKISSALNIFQGKKKLFYISILTSPTTGGVTASFGMLPNIAIAEPKAYIAFAGRRVIEQTLNLTIEDEDFQTAEYLFHHGLFDQIVPRSILKGVLRDLLKLYKFCGFNNV
uniref:Acetyl-coenzyme A carboxylase carboxyl transferase subunit beta, chloroplastic n=1 Tax=Halocarpus bidwillii TaxID=120591 RepID=A0A8F8SW80_9CONI|nr:acetyl-CoA carboxylase carboxyltransferase beta subunit [Halocarpus bidwillii]